MSASMKQSIRPMAWLGVIPFAVVLIAWQAVPVFHDYPIYKLPPPSAVYERLVEMIGSGQLQEALLVSLGRLFAGFVIGCSLALILGIAIALNRSVADFLRPTLTFLQSIAGVAWVPLAIIWFSIGNGAVIFVIANTIFFSIVNNVVSGVQQIPPALLRAVRAHGAGPWQVFWSLLLPGSMVQLILGLRTAMAYGWRALVAGEMIGGGAGLGYTIIEAVQFFDTETIIVGMLVIGIIWLLLDRFVFVYLETRTVVRWGLLRR